MEFEENSFKVKKKTTKYSVWNEETIAFQKHFKTHEDYLLTNIKKCDNPFIINDEEKELVQLDTRDVEGTNIMKSIKKQADKLIKERLVIKAKDIQIH